MDLKTLKKAMGRKLKNTRKRLRGTSKSYVSLFVVVILVVAGTTAWLTARDKIAVTTPDFEFKSSSGIHDDQMQTLQTEILIPNFKLEEASSVDGRNIYFPSTMYNNASDAQNATVTAAAGASSPDVLVNWASTNTSMQAQTNALKFREANAGDRNIHYAYGNAPINSAGGDTNVWLKGYKIVIGSESDITNHNEANCKVYHDQIDINSTYTQQAFNTPYTCPVRIAIIDDSGHTPKVFDPSAKLHDYVDKTYSVYSIDNTGTPTLRETTNLESFASYYYGTGTPLFTIPAGGNINMTVVAWLEGTHPYAKDFVGQCMTISIEVETNVSQMEEIYLHDWLVGDNYSGTVTSSNYIAAGNASGGQWLNGDVNVAMSYYDQFADTYKTVVMTELTGSNTSAAERAAQGLNSNGKDAQGRTVFRAAIPNYVNTKISFYRLSNHSDDVYPGTVYNAWHTFSGVNGKLYSTALTWRNNLGFGNLAETRKMRNSTTCYQHYYAIRGNGYGNVAHNDSIRYTKWLAASIGYWGTSSGPVPVV